MSEPVKERAYAEYMMSWGGMQLEPGQNNDNGILILAWFNVLLHMLEQRDTRDVVNSRHAMNTIEIEPGLYTRYPGSTLLEQHDNYVGVALLSVLNNDRARMGAVCDRGRAMLWNYNDLEPSSWRIQSQRQGGDIALYQIAAERVPNLLLVVWLAYGIGAANVVNLVWARVKTLELSMDHLPKYKRWILRQGINKFYKKHGAMLKDGTFFDDWFLDKSHPIPALMHEAALKEPDE